MKSIKSEKLGKSRKKKPYEKPDIETESILESATLACGKCTGAAAPTGAGTPPCKAIKKVS